MALFLDTAEGIKLIFIDGDKMTRLCSFYDVLACADCDCGQVESPNCKRVKLMRRVAAVETVRKFSAGVVYGD